VISPGAVNSSTIDPACAATLLLAVQRGDDGALDDLVRLCEPFVTRLARGHAWRPSEVEDIVQEVWLRLLLKAHQIRDPLALMGWLSVVTRRAAARLGHRQAQLIPTELADNLAGASATEEDALARHGRDEARKCVRLALGQLEEPNHRLLLLLHRDERPDYKDISREVRRPVGSLGPSRRRLLNRLRKDAGIARLDPLRDAS
jgi:RNA polymerase sigma factor (sigma-70 family)